MNVTGDWKTLGIVILALFILGLFDKTRPLAVWVALILAVILIGNKIK